ncbi:tetratricopeptide repeat protein [Flaviflagellibacter deserti]|uniref:Tetratricopeptide repeat protein n=1 Tax=Flaviflagellibacter deserti TaxID=2267266 RepID=A0ABV9Z1E8_9HYPH
MYDLSRASVYVLGRVNGLSRNQLNAAVAKAGASLHYRLKKRVTLVAIASGAARELLSGSRLMDALERMPDQAALISELSLQRSLGLKPPPADEHRWMDCAELGRLSGLDEELLFWLSLFDVIEPVGGLYGYRDLVTAKETARLMRAGCEFAELVAAAVDLRAQGLRLSEVKLGVSDTGTVVREIDGVATALDGQFPLPLEAPPEDVDAVVECAEDAEEEGDLALAERLYDLAAKLDRTDPIAPFNLGNVLDAQDRKAEARIAWRMALNRAPLFPEAWFNLAVSAEDAGRKDEAVTHYCTALAIDHEYPDAAYNLALLLYELGRFAEALPVWEQFIKLEPGSADAKVARSRANECRIKARGLHLVAI